MQVTKLIQKPIWRMYIVNGYSRRVAGNVPPLGPRNIRNIKRADMKAHFNALRNNGCTVSQVNKSIKVAKALLERAEVRYRDMYSLRWTFVSLARASGEAAFNVSRIIGHARSTIVDTVYAHTVDSALAGVSDSVAERDGLRAKISGTVESRKKMPRPESPVRLQVLESNDGADGTRTRRRPRGISNLLILNADRSPLIPPESP
jgi:hypothetical protein